MRRVVLWIMYSIGLLSFIACQHKDLCYKHPHTAIVRVVFDWTKVPEATPAGMSVFFYSLERDESFRFDFPGKEGGEVELQVGSYQIICYNNELESVLFRGVDQYHQHEAYTREGSLFESVYGSASNRAPRAKGTEEEPVVICPDQMWGCTVTDVEIKEQSDQTITLYPEEETCTYTYEIRNVNYLPYAKQMCASLSGMSGSLILSSGKPSTSCVTLPFEAHSDGKSIICGSFYTFGHLESNNQPHRLMLYVWMDDGSKYYYGAESEKFNVTQQIHEAPDKRHVHIVIDGLDLPQPIADDGGLEPSVDDWICVEEEIHI